MEFYRIKKILLNLISNVSLHQVLYAVKRLTYLTSNFPRNSKSNINLFSTCIT